MIETKLNGLTIHNIDSEETYKALCKAGLINENDLCLVKEDASAFNLGSKGANIGDSVMVAAVDEKGAPTKWESSGWRTIAEIVTDDQAVQYELTEDSEGNPLALSEVILRYAYGDAGYPYERVWINGKDVSYRHAASNNYYQTFWLRKVGKHLYGIDTRTSDANIGGMNCNIQACGLALNIFPNNEKIQKIKFGAATNSAFTGVTVTVLGR